MEDILNLQIEGGSSDKKDGEEKALSPDAVTFPTLIGGKQGVQPKASE